MKNFYLETDEYGRPCLCFFVHRQGCSTYCGDLYRIPLADIGSAVSKGRTMTDGSRSSEPSHDPDGRKGEVG